MALGSVNPLDVARRVPDCKVCSKCGEVKAVAEFRVKRNTCTACGKAYQAAYRKANAEKVAATRAAWLKANPEKMAAYQAAHCKANAGKVAAQRAAYRKANPEKVAAKNAAQILKMMPAYLAAVIGLPVSHLSPELIALKREQLATYRLSKQITQAIQAQGASA